jgi:predicted PhzF superfamily epimerase YddE/YHI9
VGGVTVYVSYIGGFALVVGVLAVAAALASAATADRMRRIVPYVNRISGGLLVVVGVYVGYYGLYEIRLFTANGNPEDPVIAAAGRVQGAIAGWVHQHGAWPWLIALAGLTIATIAATWRATATRAGKYRRADRATAGDEP